MRSSFEGLLHGNANFFKRLLAIYFEQNTTTERFEDYDGQRFMEATG